MKMTFIRFLMLAVALSLCASPGLAQSSIGFSGGPINIGIPYVVGPGFTIADPFAQGSVFMEAANTSTLAHAFTGSLAISFVPAGGGGFGFPAFASPGIAPEIAQTTSESIAATRSYFFDDVTIA